MPRLTNELYLYRHRFVQHAWDNYRDIFSALKPSGQLLIHTFYQTNADAEPDELLAIRSYLTKQHPSLPHRASKAFLVLYRQFRQAYEYAEGDEARFRSYVVMLAKPKTQRDVEVTALDAKSDRRISVRGELLPTPNYEQLARALMMLAEEQNIDRAA